MTTLGYCDCSAPKPHWAESVRLCERCGGQIPDARDKLLVLVARQNRKLIEQQGAILKRLDQLEGTAGGDPPEDEQRIEEKPTSDPELLAPAELARRLGVSRKFIYRHSAELGAIRAGDGPQPRLYFRLEEARQRLAARSNGAGKSDTKPKPSRRRRHRTVSTELLPVKGRAA